MFSPGERPQTAPAPPKAYKNEEFLNGPHARLLRIQCEFEEPRVRLDAHGIDNIVMIFGSARSKHPEAYKQAVASLREEVKTNPKVQSQLTRLERMSFLCDYHEETVKLSKIITEFSMQRQKEGKPTYMVGTGAGPGMMEAANEGAWRAGGRSVGFGISVPFEKGLNPYVTPELGFEFHYFFTRKFWMAYKCMGLVVAPGGYGTCDELFEILTLIQTKKIKRMLPVILFGAEYWNAALDFGAMEDMGLISPSARSLVYICDKAEDAFEHLKKYWQAQEATGVPTNFSSKAGAPSMYDRPPLQNAQKPPNGEEPERPLPPKAYKNMDFIKSSHSRVFRIQCEFEETRHRLEAENIQNTLMFVGSGSVRSHDGHIEALGRLAADAASDPKKLEEMQQLAKQQALLKYHQVARDLARRITSWSMDREKLGKASYHVATGGGPGLTESANEGAWEAGGRSLAFASDNTALNRYVTPELAFVFNYFFTQKFWMAYKCMGMVALPGGFGSCDELFELLTLMQTGKIMRKMPIVLVGVEYWQRVIRWRKMADYGMISDADVDQLLFTDSAAEAFAHITQQWEEMEEQPRPSKKAKV